MYKINSSIFPEELSMKKNAFRKFKEELTKDGFNYKLNGINYHIIINFFSNL